MNLKRRQLVKLCNHNYYTCRRRAHTISHTKLRITLGSCISGWDWLSVGNRMMSSTNVNVVFEYHNIIVYSTYVKWYPSVDHFYIVPTMILETSTGFVGHHLLYLAVTTNRS